MNNMYVALMISSFMLTTNNFPIKLPNKMMKHEDVVKGSLWLAVPYAAFITL